MRQQDATPWRVQARRPLVAAVIGLHLALTAAFFLLDGERAGALALTMQPLVTAAVLAGTTWRRRPERRVAWYLLAGGVALSGAGWGLWYLSPYGATLAGDVAFLTGYVISGSALLALCGLRQRRDVLAALDAGLLTVGFGVLAWLLLVARVTAAPEVTTTARVISTAYPVLDVLLVAVAARLVFAQGGVRSWLVLLWVVCQGAGDARYALSVMDGSFAFGEPVFLAWSLGYLCLSAAALAPAPVRVRARTLERSRTGHLVIAAAVLPLPAVLVVRAVQGSSDGVVLVAAGSLLMTVLAVARGATVAGSSATGVARTAVRSALVRSTAAFVVLALLPIAGLSWVAIGESRRAMESEVRDRMQVTSAVSSEYLRERIDGIRTLVASYASRPTIVSALADGERPDLEALNVHMTSLQAAHPDVFGAWILDRRGVMISFRPWTPSVMGVQFSYRDYFRGAVSGDRPYVSPAFTAANPESSRAVGVSMAVRGVDGEVLGVVTVGYLLDGIDGYADRLSRVQGVELPWWTSRGSRSPAGVRMGG